MIAVPDVQPYTIVSERAGYIQAIDEHALFTLACQRQATLRVERRIGEHVLPGTALVSHWPPRPSLERGQIQAVRETFVLGPERTPGNDLELGVRQLTDIALRALSPSLNDPTTAMICFDRLAEILVRVGNRQTLPAIRQRVGACLVSRRCTVEDLIESIYGLTRSSVAADPVVAQYVTMTLGRIGELIRAEHRPVVARQLVAILKAVEATLSLSYDIEPVRGTVARALRTLDHAPEASLEHAAIGIT